MKVLGIIAEYDPFHNGHAYHLEESRRISGADFIVVVMSGHFTQRGHGAILDKWERARIATEEGVDLVLELPAYFATSSAEGFARGAVGILSGLGCVTDLAFGSESADEEAIARVADLLIREPEAYRLALQEALDEGQSFAATRQQAVRQALGKDGDAGDRLLSSPNDILAVEYEKACRRRGISWRRIPIRRLGQGHGAGEGEAPKQHGFLSGATLRQRIREATGEEEARKGVEAYVPPSTLGQLSRAKTDVQENLWSMLAGTILTLPEEELSRFRGVEEGIEGGMKEAVRHATSWEELAKALQSKRYPRTRIDRMLLSILLHVEEQSFEEKDLYARVLAAGEGGRRLLRIIAGEEKNTIPVLTNINRQGELIKTASAKTLLDLDIRATDLYNLATGRDGYGQSDYLHRPYIAENL